MKNTKRSVRRHHRRRMIQRALKLRRIRVMDESVQMQVALRWANNLKIAVVSTVAPIQDTTVGPVVGFD